MRRRCVQGRVYHHIFQLAAAAGLGQQPALALERFARLARCRQCTGTRNDAWITSKVKTRLAFNGDAPASRTKVVTENGVVYLFGLLTREEADAVVAQVQKVYGVQKIVKIIEYIDNP